MGMGRRLKGMIRGMSIAKEEIDPTVEEAGDKAVSGWNLKGLVNMNRAKSTPEDLTIPPPPGDQQSSAALTPHGSMTGVGSMQRTAKSDIVIKTVAGAVFAHSAVSGFMSSPKLTWASANVTNSPKAESVRGEYLSTITECHH